MISGSNIAIHGGTFINTTNRTSRGMDLLLEWVATGAFYNSDELYDSPKCHPNTRVAVLDDIMKWVGESESARDDFMMWLFGPAGAGKSAIAKRIAEISADMGMLIATFFFSRTSSERSNKDRLIPTLAYQLALSIPDTRSYINDAIERDPTIFKKNVQTQIDILLIRALQSVSSTQIFAPKNLIIIDGLDECNYSQSQVAILEAISRSFPQHNLPIKFLLVSRPEPDIVTSFNCNEPLRSIHRRLALDATYRPDDDIRLFFSDKFEHIKRTHLLRSTIPISWPTQETLDTLVRKSSGQFVYASTVVKFVESSCHRPSARLDIILGVSPPGRMNPFAELDALYKHLLSSVDDIEITLRVLSFYVITPGFVPRLGMPPEQLLSLEPGDIQLALINLSSIVTYHGSSGEVEILHASLADFLSDKHRSTTFYIGMGSTCTEFVRRILQCMKGPDGIQAGNIDLLHRGVQYLLQWIPEDQLQSDILNFDLDAFINASIKWQYEKHPSPLSGSTIDTFRIWKKVMDHADFNGRDGKEALDRLKKCFESRSKVYHSDSRLQLLFTLAVATDVMQYVGPIVPPCRRLDILLEMDNHNLHLVDRHALDLRHGLGHSAFFLTIIPRLDDDTYASAALHCMRFLSNPPKYSKINERLDILIYEELKGACEMALRALYTLLQHANTSLELVQFISTHDIHPTVRKKISADHVWEADVDILAFLSRAGVCSNWRIISAVQRSLVMTDQSPSNYAGSDEDEGGEETWYLVRQRLDQCCSRTH